MTFALLWKKSSTKKQSFHIFNPLNCSQSMTILLPLLYRLLEHLKSQIQLQSQNSQFQSGTKGCQIMFCKLMVLQNLHYSYPCLRLNSHNYIYYSRLAIGKYGNIFFKTSKIWFFFLKLLYNCQKVTIFNIFGKKNSLIEH